MVVSSIRLLDVIFNETNVKVTRNTLNLDQDVDELEVEDWEGFKTSVLNWGEVRNPIMARLHVGDAIQNILRKHVGHVPKTDMNIEHLMIYISGAEDSIFSYTDIDGVEVWVRLRYVTDVVGESIDDYLECLYRRSKRRILKYSAA